MPLFELAACVAVTAAFTTYKCLSYCISSCNDDHSDRQHVRSHSASLTSYSTFKTQPTYRPHPSRIDTRGSYVRSEPTFKTPVPGQGSNFSRPTRSHISQNAGPSFRLPVTSQYSALHIVHTPYISRVPADLAPALQSTSPGDSQVHIRPKEHEVIRKAPLDNLLDLKSGEVESVKEFAAAKDLREQARRKNCEMQKAYKLADRAGEEGNHGAREGHIRDALLYKSEMMGFNKEAAEIIFREKNKGQSEGTVDLHWLHVKEALKYAEQEIQSATSRADRTVRFIVGKGSHSKAGIAKIGPALEQWCDERRYVHYPERKNDGVLIVQLDDAGKDVDTKNSDCRIPL